MVARFHPISDKQFAGAVVVNVFAILCTLALASVALRVAWLALRRALNRSDIPPQEYVFFNTQLGNYAACLLIAMTFNTLAGMVGLPWLFQRGITEGTTCITQGILMQIGTWSSGFFTVSIAVHTFNSLVLKNKQSTLVCRSTIVCGWVISIFMATVPFFVPKPDGDVYGVDGLGCGLRAIYPKIRFFLHLLPILVAAILSALLYSVIFLVLRGTLNIRGGITLTLNPEERWAKTEGDNYNRFLARVAESMVWYPVAYVALLVPYSVTRLLEISGYKVPFEAVVFACTCWFALGVVNVMLFYNTFRILGPAFDARTTVMSRKDLESRGSSAFPDENRYLDKDYSFSLYPNEKVPVARDHYTAFPANRSSGHESVNSSDGLLAHTRNNSQNSGYNFSLVSSPRPTMQKAAVLAHSPTNSISQAALNAPQRVRAPLPSIAASDYSVDRQHQHHPSSSLDSVNRKPSAKSNYSANSGESRRTNSWSSSSVPRDVDARTSDMYSPSRSPTRVPSRQLTLLAGRVSPEEQAQSTALSRISVTTNDLAMDFSNPRTPPPVPPPSAFTTSR